MPMRAILPFPKLNCKNERTIRKVLCHPQPYPTLRFSGTRQPKLANVFLNLHFSSVGYVADGYALSQINFVL